MTDYATTHWTDAQRARLCELLEAASADPESTWLGYWCSDQFGRPANGGTGTTRAEPGLVEGAIPFAICERGYHATSEPHRWRGCRVWIVALLGPRQTKGDKACAGTREIVGEIMPEEAIDPRVGVRIGVRDLSNANLSNANLSNADLSGADLRYADLRYADLSNADLRYADLSNAALHGADLCGADLRDADLSNADLSNAYGRSDWADLVARGAIR